MTQTNNITIGHDGGDIQLTLHPRTEFIQGALRLSKGRVGDMQEVMYDHYNRLGLALFSREEMKKSFAAEQRFTDAATPNTNAIVEELLIRAQIHDAQKRGQSVNIDGIEHKISKQNLHYIVDYMADKDVPPSEIDKFRDAVQSLDTDYYSTHLKGNPRQSHTVAQQSFYQQEDLKQLYEEPRQAVVPYVEFHAPVEETSPYVEFHAPKEEKPRYIEFHASTPPPPPEQAAAAECPPDADYIRRIPLPNGKETYACVNAKIGDSGDVPEPFPPKDYSVEGFYPVRNVMKIVKGVAGRFGYYGMHGEPIEHNAADTGTNSEQYDPPPSSDPSGRYRYAPSGHTSRPQ